MVFGGAGGRECEGDELSKEEISGNILKVGQCLVLLRPGAVPETSTPRTE